MKKKISLFILLLISSLNLMAQVDENRIQEFIHWYPAIKQVEMRDSWLENYSHGEWQNSGRVTADDRTVITPQADVNYGYSWFNISNEPIVIEMPKYDKYFSVSIFDMNHFMDVIVCPDKPVVVRLPGQKNPIEDSYDIVIDTYQGLAFTRHAIDGNDDEVAELTKQMVLNGDGGNLPYIVPQFSAEEEAEGMKRIKEYSYKVKSGKYLFGTQYEGVGDMDRAAGVFLGQLGTQARFVQYTQYIKDPKGEFLKDGSYEINVPAEGLMRNENGYWSLTLYSMEDRYLIPNSKRVYSITSYGAKPNTDGSYTLRINPKGKGENAIPSAGVQFYGVFRVYEPAEGWEFPTIKIIK